MNQASQPCAPHSAAAALNQHCFCVSVDRCALEAALGRELQDPAIAAALGQTHPHLLAPVAVFVSAREIAAMLDVARAIEGVVALPAYQEAALAWAPAIARTNAPTRGAFMGYDFHLTASGPTLIEVNTNAGGAFLNAVMAEALRACCSDARAAGPYITEFANEIGRMFEAEWRVQQGPRPLRTIAIVDDNPALQYLYPDFLIAQRMLRTQGYAARIVAATHLAYRDGVLSADGQVIDLVYNRLVDFALVENEHAPLRAAYQDGAVVVTPGPRHHALYADKRNLVLLSDPVALRRWGAAPSAIAALSVALPRVRRVTGENAGELWTDRKGYFFKPANGYGGKAVYRGDKLTHRVWKSIVEGDYVAQVLTPPSARMVKVDGLAHERKLDIRLYTYRGQLLLAAARLYQGQTTNFRTPGGGFAPVLVADEAEEPRRPTSLR